MYKDPIPDDHLLAEFIKKYNKNAPWDISLLYREPVIASEAWQSRVIRRGIVVGGGLPRRFAPRSDGV